MNWINAKDRLPEDGQNCLIWIGADDPFEAVFESKREIFDQDTHKFLPTDCFVLRCACATIEFEINEDDIYWMALKDIPKPEMK